MNEFFDLVRIRVGGVFRAVALGAVLAACACSGGTAPSDDSASITSSLGPTIALAPTDRASGTDAGAGQAAPVAVPTLTGVVVGRSNGAVSSFLGIPYAAPPVGQLRWRRPVPHEPWLGPRDASAFGSACPQSPADLPPNGSLDEDCLTLNVWTPSTTQGAAPVMVFFHGGGFFSDTGSDPLYEGSALARRGVVVVTLNYRLSQLGFLAHPALEAEDILHSAGNYGFQDQQLALLWVRSNIAAFGGDPDRVTIFGQSAGAISVCAHMVSPLSAGLFDRAIQESGSCTSIDNPLHDTPGLAVESAESLGRSFAAALGCDTAQDIAGCMRSKPVADVLAAAPRTPLDGLATVAHYQPNIDGTTIPAHPWTLIQAGRVNSTKWIGGANHDEGLGLAEARVQVIPIVTEADYEAAVNGIIPGHVSDIVALYPPAVFGSPVVAYAFFITDLFTCTMRRQAQWADAHGAQAYLYQFSRVNGLGADLGLGAFHGTEVPYVFGNFVPPFTVDATDLQISDFMMGAWTHFAGVGNPNRRGQPVWTFYRTSLDNFMEVADTVSLQTGLNAQRCDVLSTWIDQLSAAEQALLDKAGQH